MASSLGDPLLLRCLQVVLLIVWQRQAALSLLPTLLASIVLCGTLLLTNSLHPLTHEYTHADRIIG